MQKPHTKKIIVVTANLRGTGGGERYGYELINAFAKRGWDITVYCMKCKSDIFKEYQNVKLISFKVIRRLSPTLKYYFFAKKIQKLTKNSSTPIFSTIRIFNATIIAVGGSHKAFIKKIKPNSKPTLFDLSQMYLEKKCYTNAKYIIPHSMLVEQEIKTYGLNINNKIRMMFPPASINIFNYVDASKKASYREKLGLPKDKFIILTIGNHLENKGVPKVLEALSQLDSNKYHLIILGYEFKLQLPNNAEFLGLKKNVEDYYAAADCTAVCSTYEAFGLVVTESIQIGRPVIVSPFVGAINVMGENDGIILKELTIAAIKNAIATLSKNMPIIEPEFLQRKGLTWDDHILKIESLLNNEAT